MSSTVTWTKLAQSEPLERSSVCASVVGSTIYVFGGELKPRQPRDNHIYTIQVTPGSEIGVQTIPARATDPSPRVGAATTSLSSKVYMFSGRGGEAMAPIEEKGKIWVLDTSTGKWTSLSPLPGAFPEARSYHCMTNNAVDTIYIHAGCPEKGRLSDLWAFNIHESRWKELSPAPSPPRGGASVAFFNEKIYRMNGFDGKTEQGGNLDIFDTASNSWSTHSFEADGQAAPGARSVSALVPVNANGSVSLVTLFGESDPSSLGHAGVGKMLSDGWAFSLQDQAWSKINASSGDVPQPRGWFAADAIHINGKEGIVIVGGLGESNERLGEVWLLTF